MTDLDISSDLSCSKEGLKQRSSSTVCCMNQLNNTTTTWPSKDRILLIKCLIWKPNCLRAKYSDMWFYSIQHINYFSPVQSNSFQCSVLSGRSNGRCLVQKAQIICTAKLFNKVFCTTQVLTWVYCNKHKPGRFKNISCQPFGPPE